MKKNNKLNTLLHEIVEFEKKSQSTSSIKTANLFKSNNIKESILNLNKYYSLIEKNYYTFLPEPEKDKRMLWFRKIIFSWLFKYSFRQVIFNEYVKNYIKYSQELTYTLLAKIEALENKIK